MIRPTEVRDSVGSRMSGSGLSATTSCFLGACASAAPSASATTARARPKILWMPLIVASSVEDRVTGSIDRARRSQQPAGRRSRRRGEQTLGPGAELVGERGGAPPVLVEMHARLLQAGHLATAALV